jgi:hypothetical protein
LEHSSKSNGAVASWSEDEDPNKERQDEIDREIVHGDSGNAPFAKKRANFK